MVLKSYSFRVKGLGLWCLGPIQGFRVQGPNELGASCCFGASVLRFQA